MRLHSPDVHLLFGPNVLCSDSARLPFVSGIRIKVWFCDVKLNTAPNRLLSLWCFLNLLLCLHLLLLFSLFSFRLAFLKLASSCPPNFSRKASWPSQRREEVQVSALSSSLLALDVIYSQRVWWRTASSSICSAGRKPSGFSCWDEDEWNQERAHCSHGEHVSLAHGPKTIFSYFHRLGGSVSAFVNRRFTFSQNPWRFYCECLWFILHV